MIEGTDGVLYGTSAAGGSAGGGTVFRVNKDGTGYRLLTSFGTASNSAIKPAAALLQGSDGALYGTSEEGGQFGYGTIFRLTCQGTDFTVLKSFDGANGAYPDAQLLEASDGALYGTASGGGTNDCGLIFRLGKDGQGFGVLTYFSRTNAANPEGRLLEASDGALYGTASSGYTNSGIVFSLQKDGGNFTILKYFGPVQKEGLWPLGDLVEGTNGLLYGTTSGGGTNAGGTIYQIAKDGSSFAVLHVFSVGSGLMPMAGLKKASDGALYGTAADGGAYNYGVVFRIDQDGGNYTVLADLLAARCPVAGLLEGNDGLLYGTTQLGGSSGEGAVFKLNKDGAGFSMITSFSHTGGDGDSSAAGLANSGVFYGTTRAGGSRGAGTVFSIRFDGWNYRQLSSLSPDAGISAPLGGVLPGADGGLYGVSPYGGSANLGSLFKLQSDGSELASFYNYSAADNGQEPRATLIRGSDGALYGATVLGGSGRQGTVFRINADGSGFAVLKSFTNYYPASALSPGGNPAQPLLEGQDQQLYGVAYSGGSSNNGVVFRLSKTGTDYTVLKNFGDPTTQGANPLSPLVQADDGALYGATCGGGTNNAGTIFRLGTDGTDFQVIHTFVGTNNDARHPCGSLALTPGGVLYGTSERGGVNDQGALFTLRTNGSAFAVLASFNPALGIYPRGGLIIGPDAALYGTTGQGGDMAAGTIFRYGAPLETIADVTVGGNSSAIGCVGAPGTNYFLERITALDPVGSWTAVSSTNAPAQGRFRMFDPDPPASGAFYRLRR